MYAVFGVSMHHAMEAAKKRVKHFKKAGDTYVPLSEPQWLDAVKETAQVIYSKAEPVQLSISYASKREALQFIELAKKSGDMKFLSVRKCIIEGGALEDTGLRKKKPKYIWVPA